MDALVLDAAEWQALIAREDVDLGTCPLTAEHVSPEMLVVAVLDLEGGRILATWPLWNATHLDGLWVAEDFQGNPGVLRPLLEGVSATLAANQVHTSFLLLAEHDTAGQEMAHRLGFARMPGLLYRRETPA